MRHEIRLLITYGTYIIYALIKMSMCKVRKTNIVSNLVLSVYNNVHKCVP